MPFPVNRLVDEGKVASTLSDLQPARNARNKGCSIILHAHIETGYAEESSETEASQAAKRHGRTKPGYCTRPEGIPCEYETICESCSCFVTTKDFLLTLYSQRQDADEKGHTERAQIFSQLIQKVESSQ